MLTAQIFQILKMFLDAAVRLRAPKLQCFKCCSFLELFHTAPIMASDGIAVNATLSLLEGGQRPLDHFT